jgi:hypothetical protein
MKIILVGNNTDDIRNTIEEEGHVVVAETDNPEGLVNLIVKHEPHFVFINGDEFRFDEIKDAQGVFRSLRLILLDSFEGPAMDKAVRQALRCRRIEERWDPASPEQRRILLDPEYKAYCSEQKLKRPVISERFYSDAGSQLLRLIWMLRTARKVRERANRYRDAFTLVGGYEWQEIIYRTVHGSFKSAAFGRDQAMRYFAYLAHFVPAIDLDGLPHPIDVPAQLRYVHYHSSLEAHYCLFSLGLFGFNSELSKQLYEMLDWHFEGESDDDLARTSVEFTGLAFTLYIIGFAQATVTNWLLNPRILDQLSALRPRALHRAIQTFTDFWDLRHVMDDPKLLATAVEDYQTNPDETLPAELVLPNFSAFHQAIMADTPTPK